MSEAVREESQCVRRTSAALRAHSAGLVERGTDHVWHLYGGPPAELDEVHAPAVAPLR